uniref:G_PROTEIN_RECEP_F1_2 domain-containing protein n=1 Tax=Heterorhabditis bacteriophora TaxID=37862 RepID=A0A1I7XUB8_HETBA
MQFDDFIVPILLFFNIAVVITFPLHIIFVFVLIRRRKSAELGSPFHHLLLNIGVSDLINATGYLFLQEPAWLGIFPEFFLRNAWFIAKIVNICGITVSNVPLVIHFFLALNRFTAIRLPIRHHSIWRQPTVLRISVIVWITAGCLSVPMIYPVKVFIIINDITIYLESNGRITSLQFRGYVFSNGHLTSVAFQFVNLGASSFYTTYVLILKDEESGARGGCEEYCGRDIVLATVIGSQQLYWMLYSEDLIPIKIYWLLFKVGHDLHNIATPWVMVLLFSRIRRDIRYVLVGSTRSTYSASNV